MDAQPPYLVHLGNNSWLNANRILTVFSPRTANAKRMLKRAADAGTLLDFTFALATKGVILCDNGVLIRIPIRPMDVERNLRNLNDQKGVDKNA